MIIKTIPLYFLLLFFSFNSLFAQKETGNGLLFPQFEEGLVIFKGGARSQSSFNYNMIQQQMLFVDADSTVLTIARPLEIIAVLIGKRRFLPISATGIFYEEIPVGKNYFYVERRASVLSKGKAAAYGGYSHTSSATSYDSWDHGGNSVKLRIDEKIEFQRKNIYYLKFGNRYKSFLTTNTLGKLFKGHESEIKEFADEHSIDFSKIDDVSRIVEYAYSLK